VVRINKRKIARFLLVKFKINRYEHFDGAPSVALRYLETLRELGIENDSNGLDVFYPPSAADWAWSFLRNAGLQEGQPLIGVCPSAKHFNKMWLKDRFAQTAATLALDHESAVALFGAGPLEKARGDEIKQMIHSAAPQITVINLAGEVTLTQTTAIFDRCSIVITNDSGLMHIAAARKRKVVAIFGPTVKELGFFPFGTDSIVVEHPSLPCRPCTHIGLPKCPKKHFRCMMEIPSSEVIESARRLLQE
ncbi:MAG: glycosyltransferase family 9 protein, partial [Ignavibacteriae bacterium]|nr:glycosyltransferase family 9 protein [Ignavibacteriota bacterium]